MTDFEKEWNKLPEGYLRGAVKPNDCVALKAFYLDQITKAREEGFEEGRKAENELLVDRFTDELKRIRQQERQAIIKWAEGQFKGHRKTIANWPYDEDLNFWNFTPCGIWNSALDSLIKYLKDEKTDA